MLLSWLFFRRCVSFYSCCSSSAWARRQTTELNRHAHRGNQNSLSPSRIGETFEVNAERSPLDGWFWRFFFSGWITTTHFPLVADEGLEDATTSSHERLQTAGGFCPPGKNLKDMETLLLLLLLDHKSSYSPPSAYRRQRLMMDHLHRRTPHTKSSSERSGRCCATAFASERVPQSRQNDNASLRTVPTRSSSRWHLLWWRDSKKGESMNESGMENNQNERCRKRRNITNGQQQGVHLL